MERSLPQTSPGRFEKEQILLCYGLRLSKGLWPERTVCIRTAHHPLLGKALLAELKAFMANREAAETPFAQNSPCSQ